MNLIQSTILTSLPMSKKKTPSGWLAFNAPCCIHNGEGADRKKRGGIMNSPDGTLSYHCFNCGYRELNESIIFSCKLCESKMRYAGPLWIGKLFDDAIISDCISLSNTSKENRLFDTSMLECSISEPFYVSDHITNILKKSSLPLSDIIEKLQNSGFSSSPTIFNPNGFRTDANINEIKSLLH